MERSLFNNLCILLYLSMQIKFSIFILYITVQLCTALFHYLMNVIDGQRETILYHLVLIIIFYVY